MAKKKTATAAAATTRTAQSKKTTSRRTKPATGSGSGTAPAWLRAARTGLPAATATRLDRLTLKSEQAAATEVKALRLKPTELPKVVAGLHGAEPAKAQMFTKGVIANWRTKQQAVDEGHALFGWAHKAGKNQRIMLIREMNRRKQGIHVVDNLSELSRNDARTVMKEYFAEGGRIEDVAEWLRACGEFLRKEDTGADAGTDDILGAIVKGAKKIVGAVKQAINTVADALSAAAKGLGAVIKDVVGWSAGKLKDLAIGLLKAGRTVGTILTEAAKVSAAALTKFVRAVLDAGRSVADVISWAGTQTAAWIRTGLSALKSAGRTVAQIVSAAAQRGAAVVNAIVNGLIAIGESVRNVVAAAAGLVVASARLVFDGLLKAGRAFSALLAEVARFTGTQLRNLVHALYAATKKLGAILVQFARNAASAIRTVLEGLFAAGVTLGNAIKAIVNDVAEGFRKGFFQGLIALGKGAGQIMLEALKFTGSVAALAFAALLEVFGGHRPLTAAERKQAARIFGTSIDLSRVKVAVNSFPADFINAVNGARPFTTMYILNFASWKKVEMKTLIHEVAHVWQAVQVGPIYMLQALHAQITQGTAAYTVTNDMLRDKKGNLDGFNREQQAVIAEEYWFNVWGKEIYPNPAKAPHNDRKLDSALLKPYMPRFKKSQKTKTATAARTTARETAILTARTTAIATPRKSAKKTARKPARPTRSSVPVVELKPSSVRPAAFLRPR